MSHTASNASKALLEVLTARGQEINFGLQLSACGTESLILITEENRLT